MKISKICPGCRKEFEVLFKNRLQVHCCTPCLSITRTKNKGRPCLFCGKFTKNPKFCSGHCRGRKTSPGRRLTEETKQKISKSVKNNPTGWAKNPRSRKNFTAVYFTLCQKCNFYIVHRHNSKRKYHNDCWKQLIGGYRENSVRTKKSFYKGYYLHSSDELKFAKLLDKNNIKWTKNNGSTFFLYAGKDNKKHKYFPDFYLPDYLHWVEIKAKYYEDEYTKIKLAAVGENIELIYSHELKLPSIVNGGHSECCPRTTSVTS